MPIQVFVDESGGKGQGPIIVFAALLSPAAQWATFSDAWATRLGNYPPIEYFKMREAASRVGQFSGWSTTARDEKVRALARIIDANVDAIVHIGLNVDAFAELAAPRKKPLNDPYFWTFQFTIIGVASHLYRSGLRDQFEIIFDEHDRFSPMMKAWYPLIRDLLDRFEFHVILPTDILFRDDKKILPLQASDLFAWCLRRGNSGKSDHPFAWLLSEIQHVSESPHSKFYNRARVAKILTEPEGESERLDRDLRKKYYYLF